MAIIVRAFNRTLIGCPDQPLIAEESAGSDESQRPRKAEKHTLPSIESGSAGQERVVVGLPARPTLKDTGRNMGQSGFGVSAERVL